MIGSTLAFSTKAQTLAALQGKLRSAAIADLDFFTTTDWRKDSLGCVARVTADKCGPWIVRSSCRHEDQVDRSGAGSYLSRLNVDKAGLAAAIEAVISSYGEGSRLDEVLIQPMLRGVVRAGVALSHDPNTCAAYRIVNWTEGPDTTGITGGRSGRTWQQAAESPYAPPDEIRAVLDLLRELQSLFGGAPVDCEFAVTKDGVQETLWLLQARPLVLFRDLESTEVQTTRLTAIEKAVARGFRTHPFLYGKRTLFGVMPDWNPAEIIGIRPRPLALSLYRALITDSTWADQRHKYGYRDVRGLPLMTQLFGAPYIDVRASFNSFVPADLSPSLGRRLVDHYIERLSEEPELHDKIEFDVVFSCYTPDLPDRLKRLRRSAVSASERTEIADSLRRLTNRITHPRKGLWRRDADRLKMLSRRRATLMKAAPDGLERIYWLVEDARRYGALPFAGLARAGFVAAQMLRSLVVIGLLSQADADDLMRSVSTISGQLVSDRFEMDRAAFLDRYGHLRPGTYDICSARYDEAPDIYFDWTQDRISRPAASAFALTSLQTRRLAKALDEHGLGSDPGELLRFIKAAIELREQSKFEFTRNLSDALSWIAEYGAQLGLSRDDLSYCDIAVFSKLHLGAAQARDELLRSIEAGRRRFDETLRLSLPPLIARPEDVWGFEAPKSAPSFVTQGRTTGRVAGVHDAGRLNGAIVCLPNADPGFDWLFTFPIAGFITAWGGVNSHMAIRAGELNIPAVIGAGEDQYRLWSGATYLHVDCPGRRVEILS